MMLNGNNRAFYRGAARQHFSIDVVIVVVVVVVVVIKQIVSNWFL
jgi:hypothetical protein